MLKKKSFINKSMQNPNYQQNGNLNEGNFV